MVAGSNPVTPTTIFPEASAEKQGLFLLWRAVRAAHGQRSALQDVDCDPQIRCIFFSGFHFDEAYFDIRPNSPNFKRKFQNYRLWVESFIYWVPGRASESGGPGE